MDKPARARRDHRSRPARMIPHCSPVGREYHIGMNRPPVPITPAFKSKADRDRFMARARTQMKTRLKKAMAYRKRHPLGPVTPDDIARHEAALKLP
jgi:hypothetical protein